MKKALKLTLAVALMMGATSLYAQKFGRINSQEIVMAMPETKEMEKAKTPYKELKEMVSPGSHESKIIKLDMEMIEADDKA